MSVMDPLGNVGTVVGFHSTRSWGFRRPVRDAWVIVEFKPQRRSYMAAADLRVVERKVA
jgi:hypothetical protein